MLRLPWFYPAARRLKAMKRIYTWGAQPALRNVTLADLRAGKGNRKFTQVKVSIEDEAAAAAESDIDMIVCTSPTVDAVRRGNNTNFLTATIAFQNFPTETDVLREAFRVLTLGADAILTPRNLDIVTMLAKEDIPVMGHLGLVPRKSTWTGGLRAVGKTAKEAIALFDKIRQLEDAGAALVEVEVVPGPVMAEISKRTGLITISLGSGSGADVMYLFMEDLTGENPDPPRHARAFGDLARLQKQIQEERINAITAFQQAASNGQFPGADETVSIEPAELESFLMKLDQ
ncbi:MAG: ketopantoate hydroxymethyltransferase [Rhodospirillaceae bacterium]|nr:ketopantoate hydroxymethyltransferase [Rhodospirillaceae bacterium]